MVSARLLFRDGVSSSLLETSKTRTNVICFPQNETRLAFYVDGRIDRLLVHPGILLAKDPSPAPTPSLEERVGDLEQRIQAIEHIPGVAFALQLRGPIEQSSSRSRTNATSESPLELVSWEYRLKRRASRANKISTYLLTS